MAVPTFLNNNYRYLSTTGITDVNTIITDLYAELVTSGSPAWTGSVTGTPGTTNYTVTATTPARSDNVSATLVGVWVSASRIRFTWTDQNGVLVNNQTSNTLDINTSPTTTEVRYFTNEFGVCVDSVRATPETFACGILDKTPLALAYPRAIYWATQGPRNNTGTLQNQTWDKIYVLRPGQTAYDVTTGAGGQVTRYNGISSAVNTTFSGAYITWPYELSSAQYTLGRAYQAVMIPQGAGYGTEVVVPIDVSTTGTFKIVGMTAPTTNFPSLIGFRKA